MARPAPGPGAAGAVAGGLLLAGTVVTGAVLRRVVRRIVADESAPAPRTPVLGVDRSAGTVRFGPTPDSLLRGRYSFWFDEGRGHARVGEVLTRSATSVTRELLGVDSGDLAGAADGRFNGWMWLSPEGLDLPFDDVKVQTTVGAAPAWVVPAEGFESDRWAVLVHGRSSVRQEVLRAVPAFHRAGWNTLLVSYRDDGEAPTSEGNRLRLDDAEWLDVESAVLHALDEGAREIVLMGWSLGAAIVLQTLHRSRIAGVVTGVVLDSPAFSRADTLLHSGAASALPPPVRRGAAVLAASRIGGRLAGADPVTTRPVESLRAADLAVPVLVLHSDDDAVAPAAASRRLAALRPDLVRLVPFAVARHTRLWNYDRRRWEAAVGAWLRGDAAALADAGAAPAQPTGSRQRA